MFSELLAQANGFFESATNGPLADNIAKFAQKQYNAFLREGFTEEEAIQFVSAILGKKS